MIMVLTFGAVDFGADGVQGVRSVAFPGNLDVPVRVASTVMVTLEDREQLASDVLAFADELSGRDARAQGR